MKFERLLEFWRCVFCGYMFECLDYIYEVKMVEEMEKVMIIIFLNGDKLFCWMFMDILKDMYMFEVSYVIFLV